tara:strand:- start:132 stop:662 length:531 start_codon:yes stop_codon:yes gene_type:complete
MYFDDNFPVIPYDSVGDYKFKDVTNLLRRVAVRAKVRTNVLLYDTYDVKSGETPESLSHRLYGDSEYHWIIMLVNDITDRYHDWPMSEGQFQQYMKDKYSDADAVHHYEISQESGDTDIKINIGTSNTDYPTATLITNYEYEQKLQDDRRKIRLLDPSFIGQFVTEYQSLMSESNI